MSNTFRVFIYNKIMKSNFSERLKELRAERRMKQEDLAKQLKLTKSTISGWEVGRNQPSYEILIDLSNIFDVSVDFLIGKSDY